MGTKTARTLFSLFSLCCMLILLSCDQKEAKTLEETTGKSLTAKNHVKPNILWIVAEDLSSYIPDFGDSTVVTPNLSKLASEGVCYDNFFAPHPVCAPARAAIITGLYANSIGASHMRTGPWYAGKASKELIKKYQESSMPKNLQAYEAVPDEQVKMFTEYLRQEGYYCTNNSKEDYQFLKTPTAWDESSNTAHWKNRAPDQPFFSVFNIGVTHESQIWKKEKDSLWVSADLDVPIPPYLPDSEIAKNDIRRMYSNIKEMDDQVGRIIEELKNDNLLDNTIIVWYTDHGGPLPRQKRLLYDSGIKVPMIIRIPNSEAKSIRNTDLISFVDLAPTTLSLAGIKPPIHMQGMAFLGDFQSEEKSSYVFAAADRFDQSTDRIRSVRDKRFKYIKYYETEKPMYLDVAYRNQMPIMQELHRLKKEGNLNEIQALWFRDKKPKEELFDIQNDPYEINDLANNPTYLNKLEEMRSACEKWVNDIDDTGLISEEMLLSRMYPNGRQPETKAVITKNKDGVIQLFSNTRGASIGYKVLKDTVDHVRSPWMIYQDPIELKPNEKLLTIAHRIGYQPSKITQYTNQ